MTEKDRENDEIVPTNTTGLIGYKPSENKVEDRIIISDHPFFSEITPASKEKQIQRLKEENKEKSY
jgi:hypothetical protein